MFLLACLYASLPLLVLAAGASHELLAPPLSARRRRRERGRMLVLPLRRRAA